MQHLSPSVQKLTQKRINTSRSRRLPFVYHKYHTNTPYSVHERFYNTLPRSLGSVVFPLQFWAEAQ